MASAPNRTSYADYDNDDLVDRRSFRGSPGNTPLDFSGGGSGRGLSGRGESVSHHSDLEQSRFQEAPSGNYPLESDTFDQDGEHEDSEYDPDEWEIPVYPMREYVMHLCCFEKPLRFNPVVSAIGVAVLWGFSLWCIIDPEGSLSQLLLLRAQSTEYFTWFYIVTRPLFLFFVIWLTYRYGHIRMGEADSVPEYSNTTYVAMMFSAGVATGLFYFAVSEPLWHENSHWFAKAGYHPQDEIDMFAINLTLMHWGISAWCVYLVVTVAMGLATFRFSLPMTFRSCFYPIIGEYAWGWIGDVLDGFTLVTTVSGVCTSLGLGAFQIVEGLKRMGLISPDISANDEQRFDVILVWVITFLATSSVVSGIDIGIKYMSLLGFCLGMLLLFLVFFLDKSTYLLNLEIQSIGYYLQYSILQLNFWTDAFGQLKAGEGRAVDGHAAEQWWMDSWTVFYSAWWTAWAGFVGLFTARISKGRTIAEVVTYSLVAPVCICFLWFCTWGGIGLRQARQALELIKLGGESFGDEGYFLVDGSTFCYNVPQEDLIVNGTTVFTNSIPGVTPVCTFDSTHPTAAFFNVLYSFSFPDDFESGFGPFLAGLSIISTVIFFVTSSDSGSFVVDYLAANGNMDHHWLQRVFWSTTEGACAMALILAGGSNSLQALQAASIIAGLPFTVFLLYLLQSTVIMCEQATMSEDMWLDMERKEFQMPCYGGVLNFFEFLFSLGRVHEERVKRCMHLPTFYQVVEFSMGLVLPFVPLAEVLSVMNPKPTSRLTNLALTTAFAAFHVAWIGLFASVGKSSGLRAFAYGAFLINGVILTNVKNAFRTRHAIHGNFLGDFITSTFMFPQVLCQLRLECEEAFNNRGKVSQ